MHLTKNNYFSKKYAVVTAWFCLVLLTVFSDDNNKDVSRSSFSVSVSSFSSVSNSAVSSDSASSFSASNSFVSSSPYVGQWHAPAYGYVLSVGVALV